MTRYGGRAQGTFSHFARKAGRSADHTSPLREIVDYFVNEHGRPMLRLECGHVVGYPSGGWSDTYTPGGRRRCRPCAKEQSHV